jgi:activator of 2-hydroxyglutaryl-CoA dehydratase
MEAMVASALGSNLDPANLDQTEASRSLARLGIDVGGTFTDLVLLQRWPDADGEGAVYPQP